MRSVLRATTVTVVTAMIGGATLAGNDSVVLAGTLTADGASQV